MSARWLERPAAPCRPTVGSCARGRTQIVSSACRQVTVAATRLPSKAATWAPGSDHGELRSMTGFRHDTARSAHASPVPMPAATQGASRTFLAYVPPGSG